VLVPSSLTLLNHTYTEPAERSRAVGLWLAGASIALAAGPLVGGLLIAGFGWRAIFFINVPLALAGIGLTRRYAAETSRSRERAIDRPGQLLAVVCLAVLVGAPIEGGVRGFAAPAVLAGFAIALLALAAFVVTEARRQDPMLPLSLFQSPPFSVPAAIGLLVNVAIYGLIFVLSLYLQTEQHHTPLSTGLALLPFVAAVGAPTCSPIVRPSGSASRGRSRSVWRPCSRAAPACSGSAPAPRTRRWSPSSCCSVSAAGRSFPSSPPS
jgi:DHA2 family methylenomycin A resistance protein-like MFS transporter